MVKCLICNKEFENFRYLSYHLRFHKIKSKDYYDKYLKKEGEGICPMYGQIPSCKKETSFNGTSNGYLEYCSLNCMRSSDKTKNKRKNTNLEKYGNICSLHGDEIKIKTEKTWNDKYGGNPLCNDKIQKKAKETNLKKYGVDNPAKSKKIKEKTKKIYFEKYGCHPSSLASTKQKVENTNYRKYGQKRPLQNKNILEKLKKTNILRYGVEFQMKRDEIKKKLHEINIEKFISFLYKQLEYLDLELLDDRYRNEYFKHRWKCLKCEFEFEQIWIRIQQGFKCQKCYPRYNTSKGEKELSAFIKSIENSEIIENSKNIISPYELDIYIPEKNIAIEFDGLYWHSEDKIKDKNYHLNKTEECLKKNIQLIHIFEDEWILKQDIVKSRLKQILGLSNSERIHARKCIIKEIDPKIKNLLLNKYHIQGEDRSSIKLGAFYNDELISVMTFSKGSIAKGSRNIEGVYELSRLCSNSNYHIPGIASKLLSYFKRNFEWNEIFSYANRRWSDGNVYKKIGFELDSITKPNYFYIKGLERIHRFNLRKRPDEPKDIPEWILRQEEGYYRIYDCGHYKFKMENKNKEIV